MRERFFPLPAFIERRATDRCDVEAQNAAADHRRYFDATAHAAYLYGRVAETVDVDPPDETAFADTPEARSVHGSGPA
ncbi:MAG: hypothetical protein MI723_09830 [Caulobacterales bacterium]|nr:hypothetical protein [Caulobacterales bacterium]